MRNHDELGVQVETELLDLLDDQGRRSSCLSGGYPYLCRMRFTATRISARTLSFCSQSILAFILVVSLRPLSACRAGCHRAGRVV